MKIYLDDIRKPLKDFILCKWPNEVIDYLKTGKVTHLSLDHDLGDDERGTGYDVILWIEKEVITNNFKPPIITVHSANVSARIKMEAGIRKINNFYKIHKYNKEI